jgi:hypothetical protein
LVVGLAAVAALAACGSQAAGTSSASAEAFAPTTADAAADPVPLPSPSPPPDKQSIKSMLYDAALLHGVNPGLVMAVAWYESGWNQAAVSSTGAIGIMQVEPDVAAYAGPSLLGRPADPRAVPDNIELGTAILREDLDRYDNDLVKALVAYNAGGGAVKDWPKLDSGHQQYVLGIYNLAVAFDKGQGPA